MRGAGESYDRLAWLYDALAHAYSAGKIKALKAAQISELKPGERVLYVGVGGGEDAVLAAQRGVALTVLDISPMMLEHAARKFRAAGVEGSIEMICADVLEHERPGYYDVVVANFFLNMFSEPTMIRVLTRLASMLKPDGKMLIGDFSHPRGSATTRAVQRSYYFVSMFSFWLFGGTTLHPIYDYPHHFAAASLQAQSVKRFRVSALFPASFETITAIKS